MENNKDNKDNCISYFKMKMKVFTFREYSFQEYANGIYIFLDFDTPQIRFFKKNKKFILKILMPCCLIEFAKALYHGFKQNNLHRMCKLEFDYY